MTALFSHLVLFVVCFYCQDIGVVIHSQPTRETIAGVLVTSRVESSLEAKRLPAAKDKLLLGMTFCELG